MVKKLLFILIGAATLFSCVGNKKLVYLQKDDLKKEVELDSIQRIYNLNYEEYQVQPEDVLLVRISSLTDEEFDVFASTENQIGGGGGNNMALRGDLVDEMGEISLPVVGKVSVQGLTIFEIQDKITAIASDFVEQPIVRVRILNFRFTVLGEVNGEGTVVSQNTRTTFMEAIGLAGGLSELADRSKVKVIRQQGETASVFYVDLLEEDFLESDKFFVYQNDIIIVPPLPQRPIRRYYGQNLGLLVSTISAVLLLVNILNN